MTTDQFSDVSTAIVCLGGIGATIAGYAGWRAARALRVPAGNRLSDVLLNADAALAEASRCAAAGAGACVVGGALIASEIWLFTAPSPGVWFYAGLLVLAGGPAACVAAARRSRAMTRAATIVMRYELGFPAGLRDHDAALESALAAERTHGPALRRYARARERALTRARGTFAA